MKQYFVCDVCEWFCGIYENEYSLSKKCSVFPNRICNYIVIDGVGEKMTKMFMEKVNKFSKEMSNGNDKES